MMSQQESYELEYTLVNGWWFGVMVTLFIASTKFRMLYLVITGIMTIFGSVRQYY